MADDATLSARLRGNIESMSQLQEDAERDVSRRQALIERTARTIGRPTTLFALLVLAAGWIVLNENLADPLDAPPFFWLQGALSMYAALITTMVLITQSRQQRDADRRAHLELQVNLLAEQKATKIISLLEELRHDLPDVRDRVDPNADALQEEVDPKTLHDALRTRR